MGRLIEKKLYHQQVYDFLKSDILDGKLRPGDKLNENTISQTFGVSRSPVREAIRMLEQDELVVMGVAGAVVNPMSTQSLKELYECRVLMEPYAVRIAMPYYTEKDIRTLKGLIEKSRKSYDDGKYEDVIRYNTEFHNYLVGICRNERLKKTIQKYQELSFLARQQEFYLYHKDESFLDEHESILQAIQSKDPATAEECMRKHLQSDYDFYCESIADK